VLQLVGGCSTSSCRATMGHSGSTGFGQKHDLVFSGRDSRHLAYALPVTDAKSALYACGSVMSERCWSLVVVMTCCALQLFEPAADQSVMRINRKYDGMMA
jgi:hypothetical protein